MNQRRIWEENMLNIGCGRQTGFRLTQGDGDGILSLSLAEPRKYKVSASSLVWLPYDEEERAEKMNCGQVVRQASQGH